MAGIYLHIPFCKTRCIYCDFYSTTQSEWQERYIHSLCRELEMRKDYLGGAPIETVYFGGGTPSQLPTELLQSVFQTIDRVYGMQQCREITLEANPDDLTPAYVQALQQLPFNRISIGIQTFRDETLKLLHRRHTALQALQAVARCREAGFSNISIDLMYGLPGETPESWLNDIRQAIELEVEHISAYHLIYEEGTALWNMRRQHLVSEADEDTSVLFFETLRRELMQAGYEHYEISNFCLPGKHSMHNSSYWKGIPYLGCGPSAHSFDGKEHRQWNVASLTDYMDGIGKGELRFEREFLDLQTRYNEAIITSLRTCWGISLSYLRNTFGEKLYDYCLENARPYLQSGKLVIDKDALRLSTQGIFVSDGIMSDLLRVDDADSPMASER